MFLNCYGALNQVYVQLNGIKSDTKNVQNENLDWRHFDVDDVKYINTY